MKHIAIIPNYSGITEMVNSGEIDRNFLVKSANDGSIHFSNTAGYTLVSSGAAYNMYKVGTDNNGGPVLEADFSFPAGFEFMINRNGSAVTVGTFDVAALAYADGGLAEEMNYSETGATNFVFSWPYGDATWQVIYYTDQDLLQVIGNYFYNEEETCLYKGGIWDPENCECQTCEDNWEAMGYSSYEECTCMTRGENCDEPSDGCDGDPECECINDGGIWENDECVYPE